MYVYILWTLSAGQMEKVIHFANLLVSFNVSYNWLTSYSHPGKQSKAMHLAILFNILVQFIVMDPQQTPKRTV